MMDFRIADTFTDTQQGDPFSHPDAQRRFRVIGSIDELERALEFPWDKWTIFLHPAQRHIVEQDYSGPARVSGSAGSGKTIVALHRAVFLARSNPDSRVLLTTFSETLANALRTRLRRLVSNEPRLAERLEVHAMNAIETVADDADPEEVYNTERHLLYVACTRARDHLLVTSVEPASEFLDDLQSA